MHGDIKHMARQNVPNLTEGVVVPPIERWKRGEIQQRRAQIADEQGAAGDPFYVLSTLSAMRRRESITGEMNQAGEQFHAEFVVGHLHAIKAADMGRVAVDGMRAQTLPSRIQSARDGVWAALKALGGMASPCGSIAWDVLGRELTIEQWAANQGWVNRPVKRETASGLLIGGLGVLVAHYGLLPEAC